MSPVGSAIATARHLLNEHHLLVIRAIVVHERQQRDLVVNRRPENARRIVQIAVGLNVDRESTVPSVGQRGADRRRGAVTHRAGTLPADVLMMFVEIPQATRPAADEPLPRDQ